ncbi:MAG: glucuronate isomerase [Balneolales bacterium]
MSFIHEDFLLQNKYSRHLYHDFAKSLPIIDFHNHLSPDKIQTNAKFDNLTDIWLRGDHYKWRAMRACGVKESLITGDNSDRDKFIAWAETVPKLLKNPLYHWTHLELKRYFGIDTLLNADTAGTIWDQTFEMLQTNEYSTRNMLQRMNVKVVCTTDDPIDSLQEHKSYALEENDNFVMFPTFRPDKAMNVEHATEYKKYINELEQASEVEIRTYADLINALRKQHDYFDQLGCRASDHGIEMPYATEYKESEIEQIFKNAISDTKISKEDVLKFKSALLHEFAVMDYEKGWVFQMHFGAMRNNNTKMYNILGPDSGYDSIGDFSHARPLAIFLDRLDNSDQLPKTILYNLNSSDNVIVSTMIGNFHGEGIAGKVQHGPAWWFHDQKEGMEEHLQILANMSQLSQFVGMVTDSRSFMSIPRHEYYRRVLCNMLGNDIEQGIIPDDDQLMADLIDKLCFKNALQYFNYSKLPESMNL